MLVCFFFFSPGSLPSCPNDSYFKCPRFTNLVGYFQSMTDFRVCLSLFRSFCSIPAAGLYLCMMPRCAALSRSAGSDSVTPGRQPSRLRGLLLPGRPTLHPEPLRSPRVTRALLTHRPCDSFAAGLSPRGAPAGFSLAASLPSCPLPIRPRETPVPPPLLRICAAGLLTLLVSLPDHSHCL